MRERIAIIDGIRTPFGKMGGSLKVHEADDLGAFAFKELMLRTGFPADQIDEVIFGNGAPPVKASNPARVAAQKAGLPDSLTAFTVQRNCASGIQCLTSAADKINAGEAKVILAGAVITAQLFLSVPRRDWWGLYCRRMNPGSSVVCRWKFI